MRSNYVATLQFNGVIASMIESNIIVQKISFCGGLFKC